MTITVRGLVRPRLRDSLGFGWLSLGLGIGSLPRMLRCAPPSFDCGVNPIFCPDPPLDRISVEGVKMCRSFLRVRCEPLWCALTPLGAAFNRLWLVQLPPSTSQTERSHYLFPSRQRSAKKQQHFVKWPERGVLAPLLIG